MSIYDDGYLFDLATRMIEQGFCTMHVADHLMRTCHINEERATRITSLAFDPSGAAR